MRYDFSHAGGHAFLVPLTNTDRCSPNERSWIAFRSKSATSSLITWHKRTYNAWDLRFWDLGIRNYYTTLEERAIAGAIISPGYIAMTMAAARLATAGLLLNSPAAIIGSMCVAPFMAPSRAVCIGTIYRMPQVAGRGLVKQIGGLLLMGSGIAYALTMLLQHVIGGYEITPEIALRAIPTSQDFALNLIIAGYLEEPRTDGTSAYRSGQTRRDERKLPTGN
jgi:hypothetical protein